MSDYETVIVERDGPVAVVTMNRPDSLNSFNGPLRRDLRNAVREVNGDDSVRVAILTGMGRAFCAGADLADPAINDEHFHIEDQFGGEYKPSIMAISRAPELSPMSGRKISSSRSRKSLRTTRLGIRRRKGTSVRVSRPM